MFRSCQWRKEGTGLLWNTTKKSAAVLLQQACSWLRRLLGLAAAFSLLSHTASRGWLESSTLSVLVLINNYNYLTIHVPSLPRILFSPWRRSSLCGALHTSPSPWRSSTMQQRSTCCMRRSSLSRCGEPLAWPHSRARGHWYQWVVASEVRRRPNSAGVTREWALPHLQREMLPSSLCFLHVLPLH